MVNKIAAHPLARCRRAAQTLCRFPQSAGQGQFRRWCVGIGIAFKGLVRLNFVLDAVQAGCKNTRSHQIGIAIGTRYAVLDAL